MLYRHVETHLYDGSVMLRDWFSDDLAECAENSAEGVAGGFIFYPGPVESHKVSDKAVGSLAMEEKRKINIAQPDRFGVGEEFIVSVHRDNRPRIVVGAVAVVSIRDGVFCVLIHAGVVGELFDMPQRWWGHFKAGGYFTAARAGVFLSFSVFCAGPFCHLFSLLLKITIEICDFIVAAVVCQGGIYCANVGERGFYGIFIKI